MSSFKNESLTVHHGSTIKFDNYIEFNQFAIKFILKQEGPNYKNAIVMFTGSDDPETKQSWCPDCVVAKPIITKALEKFRTAHENTEILLIIAEVGNREKWRDPTSKYRQNLIYIPTLVTLMNNSRLTGSECSDSEKVAKFIAESVEIIKPKEANLPFCKPLPIKND